MRAYALLSQLPYLKSYLGKIMVAAFLGTHIPLVALMVFLLVVTPIDFSSALYILVIVLVATIVAAVSTLYVLYALLAPVSLTSSALRGYPDDNEVPDLPTNFNDRAGRLMADVQYTVGQLDEVIRSLEEQSSRDYLTGVLQPSGGRGAARRRRRVGRARRWFADARGSGSGPAQAGQRSVRTPGRGCLSEAHRRHRSPQHPRERLAREVGRGRVRTGVAGRARKIFGRGNARTHR